MIIRRLPVILAKAVPTLALPAPTSRTAEAAPQVLIVTGPKFSS
jgi:hypothetical protein